MVEAASRLQTELAFQTWLAKTDHHTFTYKSKTLAGLLSCPVYHKASYWSKISLPWKTQQDLLTRCSLGLDIATHWPSRWRHSVHNIFEESWCPLCACPLAGPAQEERESFIHILTDSHALAPHAVIVAAAAHALVDQLGGITLYKDASALKWADLPEEIQLSLLIENCLPCFSYTFQDPKQASAWMNLFLVSTQQPLAALLHSRKALILDCFPNSLLLPSAQTSARPQPL
jgi:hypothetical protein